MTTIPITFALRGEDLVHINEVTNGLSCDCICPCCGERLIARQGTKTIHHFAHEGGSDCAGALQTTLHLAAKAVLSRERRIFLPELSLTASAKDQRGNTHNVTKKVIAARSAMFHDVIEERRLGDIIPDLICRIGDRVLLVEIAVTHFVDDIKREKIRALGLSCVEIDLSGMLKGWNWNTLRTAIVKSSDNKIWIENRKTAEFLAQLHLQAEQKALQADRERSASEASEATEKANRERYMKFKRKNTPGLDAALRRLEEFEKSGEPQHERDAINQAGPDERAWISAARLMKLEWDNPPNFIDIEVPGESVFLIARKAWQAALYAFFIAGSSKLSIGLKTVAKWCFETFPLREEFHILHKREHKAFLTPNQEKILPGVYKSVSGYLEALAELGYLKPSGDRYLIRPGAPHWRNPYAPITEREKLALVQLNLSGKRVQGWHG